MLNPHFSYAANFRIVGKSDPNKLSYAGAFKVVRTTVEGLAEHIGKGHPWMPAQLDKGKPRKQEFANKAEVLAIDIDAGITIEQAILHPFISAHACLGIESASSTPEHHKFRIVFRLIEPIDCWILTEKIDAWKVIRICNQYLIHLVGVADPACKDASRFFFGAPGRTPFLLNADGRLPENFLEQALEWHKQQEQAKARRQKEIIHRSLSSSDLEDKIQQVRNALTFIPPRLPGSNTYNETLRVAMGVHHEFGDAIASQLIQEWSPDIKGNDWKVDKKIASFKGGSGDPVTIGTVFLIAKQYGYKPPNQKHKGLHQDAKTLLKQWQLEAKSEQKMKDIESQEAEAEQAEPPLEIDHPQEFEPSTFELILQSCEGLKEISNPVERLDKVKGLLDLAAENLDRTEQSTVVDQIAAATKIQKTVLREHLKEAIKLLKLEQREKDRAEKKKAAKFQALSKIPIVVTETGDERAPMQSACSNALAKVYHPSVAWNVEEQDFYRYDSDRGIWLKEHIDAIKALVTLELKGNGLTDLFSGRYVSDTVELLKAELIQQDWKTPKHLLPLTNGVLDLQTKKLYPHSPDRFITWQLPYEYNPDASCPTIIKWITEMQDGDLQRVQLLRAWLRAVITRSGAKLQRFLECLGPGGTGKSTFLNLAVALVGIENIHSTTLKQWEESRFDTACAHGKLLLYFTDSERYCGSVSNLKAATGGDPLRLEKKNKQQEGSFTFDGTVVIAANEAIATNDYTSGLSRRKVTVPFTKIISPQDRRELLTVSRDTVSGEFASELPGLLNWVLQMSDQEMRDLILCTDLLVPSLAETYNDTLLANNPIAAWLDANCVILPEAMTKVGNANKLRISNGEAGSSTSYETYQNADTWLYANFVQYCDRTGAKPVKLQRFSNLLLDLLQSQLKVAGVEKLTNMYGAHIKGIAIRTEAHKHLPPIISGASMRNYEEPMRTYEEPMRNETGFHDEYEGYEGISNNESYTYKQDIPQSERGYISSPIGNELEAKSPHVPHNPHRQGFQPSCVPSWSPHEPSYTLMPGHHVVYVGSRYPCYVGEVLVVASVKGGDVSCRLTDGRYTASLRPEELQLLLEV